MSFCQLSKDMRAELRNKLLKIYEEVKLIVESMENQET